MIEIVILATSAVITEIITHRNGNGKALQQMLDRSKEINEEQKRCLEKATVLERVVTLKRQGF